MSELLFNFIGFSLLGAVAIVLVLGIYTLFKGGSTSKKIKINWDAHNCFVRQGGK